MQALALLLNVQLLASLLAEEEVRQEVRHVLVELVLRREEH
eukprot:CAMPEP_0177556930 /NCGR_PEP_ID=MMETSP0369-20130122/69356_1 /TAXON_ID=447022 ORGANISM="Scrippsiella hangoei-like, Strain SHHI-4" /NCGR_SAMPLE_ID=MMETSP0369 /ASSEMBLY_ACC=CAM_ASM_000364 /LENGTH=40 /DNA_ID= /DNA_START= /DNA_END= /DNA_ORIENTATION=